MPSNFDPTGKHSTLRLPDAACVGLWLGLVMIAAAGCEQQPSDEPRGGGYTEPKTENQAGDGSPQPEARSALGKAKQSAERLINEDVAEYNKKIEEAAEGKYP